MTIYTTEACLVKKNGGEIRPTFFLPFKNSNNIVLNTRSKYKNHNTVAVSGHPNLT